MRCCLLSACRFPVPKEPGHSGVPQNLPFLVTPLTETGVGHLSTRCCLLHPWVPLCPDTGSPVPGHRVVEEEGSKGGPILASVIFFTLVGGHTCLSILAAHSWETTGSRLTPVRVGGAPDWDSRCLPSCRFREGSLSDLGQDLSLGGQRDMRPLTSLFLRA